MAPYQGQQQARAVVSVLSVAVALLLGLPIWWRTTTVYRATLPYGEIETLKSLKFSVSINVTLIFIQDKPREDLISLLTTQLNTEDNYSPEASVVFKYIINFRQSTDSEEQILSSLINPDLDSIDDYFQEFTDKNSSKSYQFLLLPKTGLLSSVAHHYTSQCFIGKYHHAVVFYDNDSSHLAETINHTMKEVFIQEHSIVQGFGSSHMQYNHTTQNSIEDIRDLKSTTGFHLSFSLINDEPETGVLRWNIKQAVADILQPLLDKIPHFDITLDSQVLHYSGVRLPAKRDGDVYYVTSDDLPHMINPIEAKLGSYVSLNPSLNFIVFVPPIKQTPLKIRHTDGSQSTTNAFLSPRWGGVLIHNVLNRSDDAMITLDVRSTMEIFVSQIRLLIGIRPCSMPSSSDITMSSVLPSGARDWEVDNLLLVKIMEYISSAIKTLTSLTQLIDKVKNMVIADHIKDEIEQGLLSVKQCHRHLSQGSISEAFSSAKKAIQSSEKAFFDPSVLELLYFPDDQKFAIYIPLFLPISLPLLISFVAAIKWFRNKDDVLKEQQVTQS